MAGTKYPGFGPGDIVMTTEGELPVEWLAPGDLVITREHGAQPILWIDRWKGACPDGTNLPPTLRVTPDHASGLTESLRLGPAHRVLVAGPQVNLHFGAETILAEIGALFDPALTTDATAAPSLHHIVLPRHEVIWTCGIWAETAGPELARYLDPPESVRSASDIFSASAQTTAMCLNAREARLLHAVMPKIDAAHQLLAA